MAGSGLAWSLRMLRRGGISLQGLLVGQVGVAPALLPKTNTTTSSASVTMRLYASQEAVQDAEHVHRPYVTRREKAIIESYAHPAREYLRGWEGDARLGEAVDSGADAAEVADQGKLVDRVVPVLNRSLESVGEVTLPGLIYDQPLRKDIVHRVVVWQRANWRQGTVKVKTRSEVRGGGRKPWPQKGTGRARAGSIRSPLFRGGGKAHGPRPKDWSQQLNSKIRRLGLRVAVSSKLATGRLTVVDELRIESEVPKTRELREFLDKFEADRTSFLLVDDAAGVDWSSYEPYHAQTGVRKSPWQWRSNLLRSAKREEKLESRCEEFVKLERSAKNLRKRAKVVQPEGLNVYDLLAFDHLIMTPRAVKAVTERLSHPPPRFY